jgi:putative nucleotidyltransferase with HDIG domain
MIDHQVPFWANAVAASLLQVLKAKEPGTFEHCLRVGEFSKQLAMKIGMSEYQQRVAEIAGYLHDLGETTIDQDIIAKPTKLNQIEYEIMKSHVNVSEEFVRPMAEINPFFLDVQKAIRSHHEQFNGMGYPDKLKASQIPMVSRILCLLDAFDSMTTSRVYKEALSVEKAYAEVEKMAGLQFDRQIVSIFIISHRSFKKSSIVDLENQIFKKAT